MEVELSEVRGSRTAERNPYHAKELTSSVNSQCSGIESTDRYIDMRS